MPVIQPVVEENDLVARSERARIIGACIMIIAIFVLVAYYTCGFCRRRRVRNAKKS